MAASDLAPPLKPQFCWGCKRHTMEGKWKLVNKGKFKRWSCLDCIEKRKQHDREMRNGIRC